MSSFNSTRRKKVYLAYRKTSSKGTGYSCISKIILEGNYLADAGFNPNDYVSIILEEGRIIIQKD